MPNRLLFFSLLPLLLFGSVCAKSTSTSSEVKALDSRLQKIIKDEKKKLLTIRTGRVSTSLVDGIDVEYAGTTTRLNTIANLTVTTPRTLLIKPHSAETLPNIIKALRNSEFGSYTKVEADSVTLTVPALSPEKKTDLLKKTRRILADTLSSIRSLCEAANQAKPSDSSPSFGIGSAGLPPEIREIADQYIAQANQLAEAKEKEIAEN